MIKASLGVAIAAERYPVPVGLTARKLAMAPPRIVALAAAAGRQHGPGVTSFLNLARARDWDSQDEYLDPASAGRGNLYENRTSTAAAGRDEAGRSAI